MSEKEIKFPDCDSCNDKKLCGSCREFQEDEAFCPAFNSTVVKTDTCVAPWEVTDKCHECGKKHGMYR